MKPVMNVALYRMSAPAALVVVPTPTPNAPGERGTERRATVRYGRSGTGRRRPVRSRVAQLAERPAVNRQVTGSSPVAGAGHSWSRLFLGPQVQRALARRGAVAQPVRAGDS